MTPTETLADRFAIDDLITRYTRAIDTLNLDLLDQVFLPDATIDYTATGGISGSYPEVKKWLGEVLPLFSSRQHAVCQREVLLEGDRAEVTAYFLNPMVLQTPEGNGPVWEWGGLYLHSMVRTSDGWRSARLSEELLWSRTPAA